MPSRESDIADCLFHNRKSFELVESPEILYNIFEFAPDAILVVDESGRIAKANAQVENMFGYTRNELLGQLIEILIPHRLTAQHVGYRSRYLSAPRTRPMGAGIELFGRRKDGTEFPVDIMLSPLTIAAGSLVLGVIRDVTERKRIEAQARAVKETYLKEVHHRVKNNLQVISSLLYLQSTYTNDDMVQEILQESQSRVKSIALIHEKLYRAPGVVRLDFAEYVRDLVTDLFRTYGMNKEGISVHMCVADLSLDVDTALPCGLVLNELVSNVLKHAFPNGRQGTVYIGLESFAPKEYVLIVRDNGVGFPEGLDWSTSNSLGLKLVSDLTRQLEGTVTVENSGGTTFRIQFRELEYKDRG